MSAASSDLVAYYPARRSTVAHLFVRQPGTFDAALCGALLRPDFVVVVHENVDICRRCARKADR